MSDDSNTQPSSSRPHRPRLSELSRETTEDDLWDIDDESPPKPEVAKAIEPRRKSSSEQAAIPTEEVPEPEPEPEPPAAEPEPEAMEPNPPPVPAEEPDVPEKAPTPSFEEQDSPDPNPDEPSETALPRPRPASPPSRRDLISLGILAAIFLGLAIWWIAGQFSDIPTKRMGSDQPDFPIRGKHAEVTGASTYWRAPVREGDNRDVARAEVSYIPAVSIKLSGGTGALRAVFRTQAGDFVGDSITRSFENGRFVDNGSDSIEFPATDGYETDGDMNGYRVGDDRWKVEILESPGANAAGSRFQNLFTIQISPVRR